MRLSYEDSPYKGLFAKELEAHYLPLQSRLDSMHRAWADFARESYELYRISHRDSERENVLSCIGYALSIQTDPELETIKDNLSR